MVLLVHQYKVFHGEDACLLVCTLDNFKIVLLRFVRISQKVYILSIRSHALKMLEIPAIDR